MKSIGILTSGGDAPGMNAAVRAAFRSIKMREPEREIVFFRDGFRGLAGRLDSSTDRNVDRMAVRDIIHRGGTFLGSGRVPELKPPPENAENMEELLAARSAFLKVATVNLYQMNVESMIVVGGDGSFRGARLIADSFRESFPSRPFRVVGIPATIDNDLFGTDFSIGYDTSLNNVVDIIRKIRDTVESHKRAIILEVMGNTSGWLALASAIAGGASIVAIPEDPDSYDIDKIVAKVKAGAERDYRYFIIVVAEGVSRKMSPGWCEQLRERLEGDASLSHLFDGPMNVRVNSVGHVARGGSPSGLDNTLAGMMGAAAAKVIQEPEAFAELERRGDVVVGCVGPRMVVHPMDVVIENSPRLVTKDSRLYQLAAELMLNAEQPF